MSALPDDPVDPAASGATEPPPTSPSATAASETNIGITSPTRFAPRAPDASAVARLLAEPYRFEFHQAVRLLHGWTRRQPVGKRPTLRFRNTLSLAFPASEIASIETERRAADRVVEFAPRHRPPGPPEKAPPPARDDAEDEDDDLAASASNGSRERPSDVGPLLERIELTPAFMGLLGTTGALPLAYSEQFAARESLGRDGAARAFLDIFQHRAVSLFHEAWRKHRLPLQFEADRRERYLPLVLSLAGLGESALRDRLHAAEGGVADDALAFYAGLLQRRTVSAGHLQRVLADYFGVPTRVTQFVGRWFQLDDDSQITLGRSTACLGHDTFFIGPRVWKRDLRVRLSFGPMTREQHRHFLPGGPAALALRELLTLTSGVEIEYEVHLCLRARDVSAATLVGTPQSDGGGARLGWDSFLLAGPCAEDREEAVYDIHARAA